ncbi:MAG: hypothetical protein KKH93_02140 [Candidatus Omnitrophica bacterium]|nr:hypothetical protein [Candidatus Omnitrophota bacterium]
MAILYRFVSFFLATLLFLPNIYAYDSSGGSNPVNFPSGSSQPLSNQPRHSPSIETPSRTSPTVHSTTTTSGRSHPTNAGANDYSRPNTINTPSGTRPLRSSIKSTNNLETTISTPSRYSTSLAATTTLKATSATSTDAAKPRTNGGPNQNKYTGISLKAHEVHTERLTTNDNKLFSMFRAGMNEENPKLKTETVKKYLAARGEVEKREFLKWADANKIPLNKTTAKNRDMVNAEMQNVLSQYGLEYKTSQIFVIPAELLDRDVAGQAFSKFGVFIVSSKLAISPDGGQLRSFSNFNYQVLLHETFHNNSQGFNTMATSPLVKESLSRLNEGMTEMLAQNTMTQLAVNHGLSYAVHRGIYEAEQISINSLTYKIAELIGGETQSAQRKAFDILTKTYLTGDLTQVEKILGPETWDKVERVATAFANEKNNDVLKKDYVAAIRQALWSNENHMDSAQFQAILSKGSSIRMFSKYDE